MFCPQCGQQQSSEEVRFCPRCGLSLMPHVALLATADATPAALQGRAEAPRRSAKRKGMRRGAKLIFFAVVLAPIFLAFSLADDNPGFLVVPFTVFLAGLSWLAYAWLFSDDLVDVHQRSSRRDLKAGGDNPSLGAAQFVPAPLFGQQRVHTAEIPRPPSVTENTTALLDKDV